MLNRCPTQDLFHLISFFFTSLQFFSTIKFRRADRSLHSSFLLFLALGSVHLKVQVESRIRDVFRSRFQEAHDTKNNSYLFDLIKTDARGALYEVRWIQQSGLSGGGRRWRASEVVQSRSSAVNEEERSTDWRERD